MSINQKVASRILQQIGYKCDIANNGREGLEALDKRHYDLVFMDMMMPEMDGLTATRAIRERQKDAVAHPNYQKRILIIAMTAHAQQSDRENCIAAGMDDYLAKPIRPADVRGIIEHWAPQIQPVAAESLRSRRMPNGRNCRRRPSRSRRRRAAGGNDTADGFDRWQCGQRPRID